MSVLPAADALNLLRGVGGAPHEGALDQRHREQLTLVLRLIFLQLAEARSLLGDELEQLHGSRVEWPRLQGLFAALHERRGGRLFAPTSSDWRPGDSVLRAVFECLRPCADADLELLGRVYEANRNTPEARRRQGTHFTPRELAEGIVARSLEPLLARSGDLRICDPAMGSGVFLLAAHRWLRARLDARDDGLQIAMTQLFGVDEDPDAVELARLSLWLETRAGALPFTCFDHALRCGDSLVGLRTEQLRRLHWDAGHVGHVRHAGHVEHAEQVLDAALGRSAHLRQQIAMLGDLEPAAANERRALLHRQTEQALTPARELADQVVAAFFCSTKVRERKHAQAQILQQPGAPPVPALLRSSASARPFHWWLEFPQLGPAGFDTIIGNPPFLGKNGILAKRGRPYLDWLKLQHPGSHGNADYAAHFFRRADELLGKGGGTIGLVATNTIGQGDTRTTGLAALLAGGSEIYDATEHLEWPGTANVTVSIVHLARGLPMITRRLDGEPVEHIDSRLRARPERADPVALAANRGLAFIGTYVLGRGFVLTPAQRDTLVAAEPRNAARIRPYTGGEQVNTSPTQAVSRFAIDFEDLSLEAASEWPQLLDIVRREVKPGRDKLGDNPDGRRRKAHWWQHGRATPALHAALAPLSRCLVTSLVNKHLVFAFQPARRLFSHKLCVFPLDSFAAFAVLQSRVHAAWAWLLSSTMRNAGINYSPSDCFETFALPVLGPALEQAGARLERARAQYMIDTNIGLTKTYNALADPTRLTPELERLRALHVAIDRAVLAAYGWTDIVVPEYLGARRAFDDQVIDRLFALNAERARDGSARASV